MRQVFFVLFKKGCVNISFKHEAKFYFLSSKLQYFCLQNETWSYFIYYAWLSKTLAKLGQKSILKNVWIQDYSFFVIVMQILKIQTHLDQWGRLVVPKSSSILPIVYQFDPSVHSELVWYDQPSINTYTLCKFILKSGIYT